MDMLSKRISVAKFTKSETAKRHGIPNVIAPEHLDNCKDTCAWFDRICDSLGKELDLNSGYRSKLVNSAVGGKTTSYHLVGLAMDIDDDLSAKPMSDFDLATWLSKQTWLPYDKIVLEYGWVHIQFAKPGALPRRELWTLKSPTAKAIEGLVK